MEATVSEPGQWLSGPRDAITDVRGIRVGHWTDRRAGTGCTVILCEESTGAAVDARGGAPGTRETDVLAGPNLVRQCHAIVFSGGSAFGLAAATGVMEWLAAREVGFGTAKRKIPIVSGAVLYDLGVGRPDAYPGPDAGRLAAGRATGCAVAQGSIGAGTGASVAKMLGPESALKGGIGTASVAAPKGLVVGALVANNASGHVFDPDTGALIAGPRDENGRFVDLPTAMARRTAQMDALIENTTLVCVATNAALDHHHLQRIAIQAHDGLARAVMPAHTFGDGDVAFAVATGKVAVQPHDVFAVGLMAVRAVERALVKSVHAATGLGGVPSAGEWQERPRQAPAPGTPAGGSAQSSQPHSS